jgi:hypothetical protein
MITEKEKKALKNTIKKLIKEAIEENYYFEDSNTNKKDEKDDKNTENASNEQLRREIEDWVRSEYQLNSTLAYHLWPEKDEDTARSLFAKKAKGQDSDGNAYDFSDAEIVKLANIRTQLNENKLKRIIHNNIRKVLK